MIWRVGLRAATAAMAGLLVAACGEDDAASAGGGGSAAVGDVGGGEVGGGAPEAAATATAGGFDLNPGRLVVEQGRKVQGTDAASYLSAFAWFTEEDAPNEDPACEGEEEGGCILVGACPPVATPTTLVDVGSASLASSLLEIDVPRQSDGTYALSFDQRLASPGAGVDGNFGGPEARFHVSTTVPTTIHVLAPVLGDPIPRDEDLEVAVETSAIADTIHFAIGDGDARVECAWPGTEGGVVPVGLLEQLEMDRVLVVAWTEQSGRAAAGTWDVAWVMRDVEYASPVVLE